MTIERIEGFANKGSLSSGDEQTYQADFYSARGESVRIPKAALEALGITFDEGDEAIVDADVDVHAARLVYGQTVTNIVFKGYLPSLEGKTLDDLYGGSEWRQPQDS